MNVDEVIEIVKKVCENCKFYNKIMGVCEGELLPVELAVIKNIEDRGLCDNVKDFIKEGINEDRK